MPPEVREQIEARLVGLKNQRDNLIANLQYGNGAIAMLEELLNPSTPSALPTPPKKRKQ